MHELTLSKKSKIKVLKKIYIFEFVYGEEIYEWNSLVMQGTFYMKSKNICLPW